MRITQQEKCHSKYERVRTRERRRVKDIIC